MRFASSGRLKCKDCGALFTYVPEIEHCIRCKSQNIGDACDHDNMLRFDGKIWTCGRCGAPEISIK